MCIFYTSLPSRRNVFINNDTETVNCGVKWDSLTGDGCIVLAWNLMYDSTVAHISKFHTFVVHLDSQTIPVLKTLIIQILVQR